MLVSLVCLLSLSTNATKGSTHPYSKYLDLFIGTGGDGFGVGGNPPGAQFPFGMIKASYVH